MACGDTLTIVGEAADALHSICYGLRSYMPHRDALDLAEGMASDIFAVRDHATAQGRTVDVTLVQDGARNLGNVLDEQTNAKTLGEAPYRLIDLFHLLENSAPSRSTATLAASPSHRTQVRWHGRRDDADPVIVELKVGFSLVLLQQAVARQAICDAVYVAVPRWTTHAGWRSFKANVGLCKRLGVGVLSVRLSDGHVQNHADPIPYQPRKSRRRKASVLSEFERRVGDPNVGGTSGSVVTAYRQDAERIAAYLAEHGPSRGAVVAKALGVANATRVMAVNHYGWFARVDRGVYGLTAAGRDALS